MGSNANYKDSVFSFLFSKPDILRELYGAITGIPLPPDIPVTINTLSDVLFMGRVNDISFTIGDVLVILMEHHQPQHAPSAALGIRFEKKLGDKTAAMEQAVRYCRDHDILKEFLEEHATEVMNMLLTEWDWDTAFAVQRMEGREEGEGKKQWEIASNALAKGLPVDMISEITGLDIEAIAKLARSLSANA